MLEASLEGARSGNSKSPPKVIGVTLLTSLDRTDLKYLGIDRQPSDLVKDWATVAYRAGLDGVVASGREAAELRLTCGEDFLIVTPGIRPAETDVNDQRRVLTPGEAIRAGANILVVGRPITRSSDPARAAQRIIEEIAASIPE
jgi:orotidine-5'-phosphate decarboxylase